MSGIPRMGKIGLKNEKYNKAFEKHIKRSNTLVSLTENNVQQQNAQNSRRSICYIPRRNRTEL